MSRRGKIAWSLMGGALVLILWITLSVVGRAPAPPPPDVVVLSAEPVDLIDDQGTELQMVTLRISNPVTPRQLRDPKDDLHVFIREKALRVQKGGEWRAAQYPSNAQHQIAFLGPGTFWETTLLAPSHAREGRLRLQFAGSSAGVILRYRIWRWMDRWLPPSLYRVVDSILRRFAVPSTLHRVPWNEVECDLELSADARGRPRVAVVPDGVPPTFP